MKFNVLAVALLFIVGCSSGEGTVNPQGFIVPKGCKVVTSNERFFGDYDHVQTTDGKKLDWKVTVVNKDAQYRVYIIKSGFCTETNYAEIVLDEFIVAPNSTEVFSGSVSAEGLLPTPLKIMKGSDHTYGASFTTSEGHAKFVSERKTVKLNVGDALPAKAEKELCQEPTITVEGNDPEGLGRNFSWRVFVTNNNGNDETYNVKIIAYELGNENNFFSCVRTISVKALSQNDMMENFKLKHDVLPEGKIKVKAFLVK